MKTCTSRLTLDSYVNTFPQEFSLKLLFPFLLILISFQAQAQTMCLIQLDCGSQLVSCTHPAAQMMGDPGYAPVILDSCNLQSIQLVSVPWTEEYNGKCNGDTAYVIYRDWSLPGQPTLCTDTTYVARIDITGDSLICPTGIDTIYCGDNPNALDSLPLRAPQYQVPGLDTIILIPGAGDYCGVYVTIQDMEWATCGQTKMVMRTWNLHDDCGNKVVCVDTLVLLDTTPPTVSFDTVALGLSLEDHIFPGFSGNFLTDTIGMSGPNCLGDGLVPYATVSDECSNLQDVKVTVTALGLGIIGEYNGTENKALSIWNVPPEKEVLIYKTHDACHVYRYDTMVLVVADRTPAIAACHDAVNLTLTNIDDFTLMQSSSMDAASYDNCGIYLVLARRVDWESACGYDSTISTPIGDFYQHFADWVDMDPGICKDDYEFGFADKVPFCCNDVGKSIMVEVLVIDNNCNVDMCWGWVNVEDKLAPRVIQPLPDITVNCSPYDQFYRQIVENFDTLAIQSAFGKYALTNNMRDTFAVNNADCADLTQIYTDSYIDGLVYDNCGSTLRERYTLPGDGCDTNYLRRDFIAMISGDNGLVEYVYATQYIYITSCDLGQLAIKYPVQDTVIYDCGISYGLDGNTTIVTPGPALPDDLPSCYQFGMGYFDKVFDIVSGIGCHKVQRTWCLVDWCQVQFSGQWSSMVGMPGVVSFTQYIKIMDTLDPVIEVLSIEADIQTVNCTAFFSSEIDATDGCGVDPFVEWMIREDQGGIIMQGTGELAAPADPLLPGNYQILWRASDDCNNVAELVNDFSISSGALPSVVNYSSITTVLTPMDTDGDNIVDEGMSEVWASEFNSSSAPPCGGSADNIIYLIDKGVADDNSPVPMYDQTGLMFSCADFVSDPTPIQIQFWVVDTLNKTADYNNAVVMLYDNHDICGGGSASTQEVIVSGSILTENLDQVANVKVKAINDDMETEVITSLDGTYRINEKMSSVVVRPEKDMEHGNGISTADLIKIQKHILGIRQITSPYRQIAADVNKDKVINPIDLIQMRRLILGKTDRFPDNTSWRFVDADYRFGHVSTALEEQFPESFEMKSVQQVDHLMKKDFVGIKVGDLDGNVFAARSSARSAQGDLLTLVDQEYAYGDALLLPIYLENVQEVEGMQMMWEFDEDQLKFIEIVDGQISLESEAVNKDKAIEGQLMISWTAPNGVFLVDDKPLFSISLEAKSAGLVSSVMGLSGQRMDAQLYKPLELTSPLSLRFDPKVSDQPPMTLLQNSPNPFRQETKIGFYMKEAGRASLTIYDPAGKLVKAIEGNYSSGYQEEILQANELSPGLMYYQLKTDSDQKTRKMILLE